MTMSPLFLGAGISVCRGGKGTRDMRRPRSLRAGVRLSLGVGLLPIVVVVIIIIVHVVVIIVHVVAIIVVT